jgi:glycosyltransferase involved in cell wall biosynthesis
MIGHFPRPLRVLHCYSGNMYGGVETLLATLGRLRALEPGLTSEFALCFDGGRIGKELREAGAMVYPMGPVRFGRPWTVLRARHRLRQLIDAVKPDAVVCHGSWPHAIFAKAVRQAKAPLVYWMHDTVMEVHWVDLWASRTPPDLALVNSRHTTETLPRLFARVRHEVLHYPVAPPGIETPSTDRAEVRRELGTDPEATVIIQTSRLERWKGQSLLIKALGRLRDLGPPEGQGGWVAWLAGGAQRPQEQAYLDELKALAQVEGIATRIKFLGQRSDVPRLLAAADIHCQPNTGPEPFGIAFIEALYAGLPVVTTCMGGAVEIVDDSCGVLVPPADPDALAGVLAGLIADPAARARLGSAGPARARRLCDPATVLGRLHHLLAGVTDRGS